MIFVISWFLHLSARIPVLGAVRFDLFLVLILVANIYFCKNNEETTKIIKSSAIHKILKILIFYIIFSLPFVHWPGSVIHYGAENFIKAVVFYYFTIYFVTDEDKMVKFITIFILCQSFRIIEPVYLHLTEGYWGSFASMANWEFMDRLSGAPSDIVNPNGLAFIVLTVIPFYYYLSGLSIIHRIISVVLMPLSIYTLLLTGSRSGLIGLLVILGGILLKSKNKLPILMIICVCFVASISFLNDNFKDRYTSIFSSGTKNDASAEGRLEGVKNDLLVAFKKPIFGFGLGTSREANANFGGIDKPSHDLYTEVAQELGFAGLVIFLTLIKSILYNSNKMLTTLKTIIEGNFIFSLNNSMQVWLYMNVLFSFASYGLSSYEWYLFAGMSVSLNRIVSEIELPRMA